MDNNLERSVRLLEDAIYSTPAKGLFKSSTTPKRKKITAADLSISLLPGELELLNRTEPPSVLYSTTQLLLESENTLRGSVIQLGTPWTSTVNNLFIEFADILQTCSGGIEILEVAADLARCCSDALAVVQKLKSTVNVPTLPEEKWLEDERNNWRLLFVLYEDRMNVQNSNEEDVPSYKGTSEKNCVKCLFKREHLVRESQLVIDWLERNALERNDSILHQSDWSYGWEHTLHQLLAPDAIAIGSNIETIKNIHPDAPQSQNKPLHHLDTANENKLCENIFMQIRCGQLEAAQELCCNTGHPWRAAMLEGWKLFHNPNIQDEFTENNGEGGTDPNKYQDIEGNAARDLWKFTTIEYCKKAGLNIYTKAALASLSGYLAAILPVCNTWEDYLWAYMKTVVDLRVESEIRDVIPKSYIPLPEEYWDQKLPLNEIFAILESSKNATVAAESRDVNHIIQKHIILDEIPTLINLMEQWIEEVNTSTQSLRFFAHLVIFFDHVGEASNRKTCEKIIEAYIKRLSEMNETKLVAFYVSKLGRRKQIFIYGKHLEQILQNDKRQEALSYGEEYGLDVFAITRHVVETVTNQPSEMETSSTLQQKLTEADEFKISSLDWLIFYEEQRVEALFQTNALIFKFLTLGKLEAAHLAINKIPSDSIEKIVSEGEVDEEVNQTIKEHLSYKAYLDAHEAFNEWFKQYKNKPSPPPNLPKNTQFTEKVVHEHRVSQYNAEMARWKLTTSQAAKTATTLLYNVLLFPEGWLVGGHDADYLRSICIPEVVLLLYSVLHESGAHEEAVRLADLLADEKYGLYKVITCVCCIGSYFKFSVPDCHEFLRMLNASEHTIQMTVVNITLLIVYSKEKLGEIMEKICESSVALLNAKKDPWGCPLTA